MIEQEVIMPILKYRCADCGKEFAKILMEENQVPTQCPVCGAGDLQEVGPAFSVERTLLARYGCTSCDTCEGESCYTVSSSS